MASKGKKLARLEKVLRDYAEDYSHAHVAHQTACAVLIMAEGEHYGGVPTDMCLQIKSMIEEAFRAGATESDIRSALNKVMS